MRLVYLLQLQRDFQRGIEELNEIRSELTSVGNMTRPHQPTGSVEADGASAGSNVNHAALGAQGSAAAAVGRGTTAAGSASTSASGVRSSVSLASSADYAMEDGVRRGAEASLAMAELKLAEQGKFVPRVESQEGGADYVSASIMDSLLLERQKPQKTQQPQETTTSRRTDALGPDSKDF
ncbi:hypothetical protein BBJ28_00011350 [Nothophytophthora sp. Chile5]|nr:hypothetical protein BBJ28_00011350 [Nothophytophthora sp. Chile5]